MKEEEMENSKSIEEYEEESSVDLLFDVTEYINYASTIGRRIAKWGRYKFNEEMNCTTIEQLLRNTYKTRYNYYMFERLDDPSAPVLDKKNVDIFIKSDVEYMKIEKLLAKQKSKMTYIDRVLSSLETQGYQLKNVLEYMKYESGK